MKHNFEKALAKVSEWQIQLGSAAQYHIDAGDRSSFDECQATNEIYETIAFALKFTDKALGEPSEEAIECGYTAGDGERKAKTIFKAMAQQIAKECGDV